MPFSDGRPANEALRRVLSDGRAPCRRVRGDFVAETRNLALDDIVLPDIAFAAFVRSPHAHAKIRRIDDKVARGRPGVLAVLTDREWQADGLGRLAMLHPMPFSDGRPANEALRRVLSDGRVRHVGECVAMVVAETRNLALDAAELIAVDYEPLPAVTETGRALDDDAPILHDEFGINLLNEIVHGDKSVTEAAFARAKHITQLKLDINRVAGMSLEPRGYLGHYDTAKDRYTLWASCQAPHIWRRTIARDILHIPESKLRVIAPDVGGGFGPKLTGATEAPAVLWASRLLHRPVRWTSTRSEALMSDCHARDHHTRARMAFDGDGRILATEIDTMAAYGAYVSNFAPSIAGNTYAQMSGGLYVNPALYLRIRGVYTNTVPVDAYRGAGRPEAAYVNERLFENAAREMGFDVAELRTRNYIRREQCPYRTPTGFVFDSGDPPALHEKLIALSRYHELRAEQKKLRSAGVFMGIGLASFLDKSGTGNSRLLAAKGSKHGAYEVAMARVHSDGKVMIVSGSHSQGQGHEITYRQIAADRLGLDIGDIELVEGDTDLIPSGVGTWGSRSLTMAGSAIHLACDRVMKKAATLAAHVMECSESDISYESGTFRVEGTDRKIRFTEIAELAYLGTDYPSEGFDLGLEETVFFDAPDTNAPSGMHVCVVVVDTESGEVDLRDYFTMDEAGIVVNPMLAEGQVHGGLAQGLGQALMENVAYDTGTGQLLSGTFMDYAMPRANDLCAFKGSYMETPAPSNPLGVKGNGEIGTIGAPAAAGNAVVDALWHLGVRHVEMPMTPERIWRSIVDAKS